MCNLVHSTGTIAGCRLLRLWDDPSTEPGQKEIDGEEFHVEDDYDGSY